MPLTQDQSSVSGAYDPLAPPYLATVRGLSPLVWFDASMPLWKSAYSTQCAAGDVVSIWHDQAMGNTASVAGGSPVLRINSDGLPGVDFGGGAYMETGSAVFTTGIETSIHIFAAVTGNPTLVGKGARYIAAGVGNPVYFGLNMDNAARQYVTAITTVSGAQNYNGLIDSSSDVFSFGVNGSVGTMRAGYRPYNGIKSTTSALEYAVTASGSAFSGNKLRIGCANGTGDSFDGLIHELIVCGRGLTRSEIRQVHEYLAVKWRKTKNIALLYGNSLTSGTGSTSGANQDISAAGGDNYPSQLAALLGSSWRVLIDAYPGRSDYNIYSEAPAYSDLLLARDPGKKAVVVYAEGTNTLSTRRAVGLAIDATKNRSSIARSLGHKFVATTINPRQDGVYAGFEADRQTYNTWVRANWRSFANALADVAADARLSDPTNTTYFNADKVHNTSAGYAVWASIVNAAIAVSTA